MANLNTAITPSPVVTVRFKDGTPVTSYTGDVALYMATNPTNATLNGTTVVAAVNGVATFSDVKLNRSGKGFTFLARADDAGTYALKPITSRPFTIATGLQFTTQPVGTSTAGQIMDTFTVAVGDSMGNLDTNYNGEITVALYRGAGLGILGGLTTRTASGGIANFSGMSIDANGAYSLRATAAPVTTAYNPAPVISNTFYIPGWTLTAVDLGGGTSFGTSPGLGSIAPGTFGGYTIRTLSVTIYVDYFGAGINGYETTITTSGVPPQSLFTTLVVNGVTFLSNAATYTTVPATSWTWPISLTAPFSTAGTYPVSFT
jgi:hypothetical protein